MIERPIQFIELFPLSCAEIEASFARAAIIHASAGSAP
jgi:hypothetical protein